MAMQLAGRPSGRNRRRVYRQQSDINVTPFVDVMLVLLVVFMVAAPLLTVGVPVDLPKSQAKPLAAEKDPLQVSVKPDGRIFVQETETDLSEIAAKLAAITNSNPEARILVRGDRKLSYGRLFEVMAAINRAGFTKVGLVGELPAQVAAAARPAAAGSPTGAKPAPAAAAGKPQPGAR